MQSLPEPRDRAGLASRNRRPDPRRIQRALRFAVILGLAACGASEPATERHDEAAAAMDGPQAKADPAFAAALDSAERQAIDLLPPGPGHELVFGTCLICHDPAIIQQQHKDRDAWARSVQRMVEWGAPLSADQEDILIDYLVEHFGPAPARTRASARG